MLSDEAEFAYKCTDFYHPGDEGGLLWSDPEIGVDWPVEPDMQLIYRIRTESGAALRIPSGSDEKEFTYMNYVLSLMKEIIGKRKLIWDLGKADFRKRFVGSYFGVV